MKLLSEHIHFFSFNHQVNSCIPLQLLAKMHIILIEVENCGQHFEKSINDILHRLMLQIFERPIIVLVSGFHYVVSPFPSIIHGMLLLVAERADKSSPRSLTIRQF